MPAQVDDARPHRSHRWQRSCHKVQASRIPHCWCTPYQRSVVPTQSAEFDKVNEPSGANTLLIVDNDVGFLWWLGEIFKEAGYRAVPALNCRQALAAVKKFQIQPDLLVVNPALTGVARLVTSLERANHDVKIVVIREG